MADLPAHDPTEVRYVTVVRGGAPMTNETPDKDDHSGWALARSMLTAIVQGVTRAAVDIILGRWGRDLF